VEQQQEQQQIKEEQQLEAIRQEERQYFTYKGQCAFNMKQRQDDLAETKNGVDTYQQEITKLTEEYEAKKKEIEEQYTVPVTNLKVKLEKAQKEFSEAQQRYDITKATCDAQQPA
jgi:phage host-nuclease inhibitor protein Gam